MNSIEIYKTDEGTLNKLIDDSEKGLLVDAPIPFEYPQALKQADIDWTDYIDAILRSNEDTLNKINNHANIYAIYQKCVGELAWRPVYIGQRKSKNIRSRIVQHFIKKHVKTGSKLAEVKAIISAGGEVAVSFIKIEPESLRLYVEEALIQKNAAVLLWNIHK